MKVRVKSISLKAVVALLVGFFLAGISLNVFFGYSLIYSATDSIKKGVWLFWDCDDSEITKGTYVLFPYDWSQSLYSEIVPNYKRLIKKVSLSGDSDGGIVDKTGSVLICSGSNECTSFERINGVRFFEAVALESDEIFVTGDSIMSFDSRYFGPIKKSIVEKCGRPLH